MSALQVEQRLLTREEAAEYLRVKPQTLGVWALRGTPPLKFIRAGRRVLYRISDLEQFLSDRTATSTAEAAAL